MGEYRYYLAEGMGIYEKKFDSLDDVREALAKRDVHLIVYESTVLQEIDLLSTYARRAGLPDVLKAINKIVEYADLCHSLAERVYVLRKMKDALEVYEIYTGDEDGLYEALEHAAEYLGMHLETEFI